jgi:putative addiction module component (TIGR02574 family)
MDSVILTSEALKLPPFERAQMIDALWRSLDPSEQTSVDAAWISESLDRLKAFREGKLSSLDGAQTLKEAEAKLRK